MWHENGRKLADGGTCSTVLVACGHVDSAIAVCESVHARIRDIASTGGRLHGQLISLYYKYKRPHLVLSAWREMEQMGVIAEDSTQLLVLSACSMVATPHAMEVAQLIFVSRREQVYDAILKVFIHCKQPHRAVELWHNEIHPRCPSPSRRTVMIVLQACAATTNLGEVASLHSIIRLSIDERLHPMQSTRTCTLSMEGGT
jgi:hypothetical protein